MSVNTLGTFGVASLSYYSSRVAAVLGRSAQYLAGSSGAFDGCRRLRNLCNGLFPLSWSKTSRGDWVGVELLNQTRQVGISQCRDARLSRWTAETARSTTVPQRAWAHHLRGKCLGKKFPSLGPLYRFLSLHPRTSVRRVPSYVSFIIQHLPDEITRDVDTARVEWKPRRARAAQASADGVRRFAAMET